MDYMDLDLHCPTKGIKLNHSLIHLYEISYREITAIIT